MTFLGWPPAAVTWFEGLEEENSKAWFDAHRTTYEQDVRGPLLALLAEVRDEFGAAKVFRPNRDVRFAADKSPYKTQCSAVVYGDGPMTGYYVEVSADGLFAASGYHGLQRDQLQRFREAVDDDRAGGRLAELVAAARDGGWTVGGSTLKTAPRGYPRDHPRVELLRHKGVTLGGDVPPGEVLHSRAALDHVRAAWRASGDLNRWLAEHVGPSAEEPDRPGRR